MSAVFVGDGAFGLPKGKYEAEWEEAAELDPFWAILAFPARQHGRWHIEDSFLTGKKETEEVMSHAMGLGYPSGRVAALDYGRPAVKT